MWSKIISSIIHRPFLGKRTVPRREGFGQKMHACATQLAYAALRAGFEL